MKKILLWTSIIATALILSGCGSKTADPITVIDNAPIVLDDVPVGSWDVADFNTIVWWSRYSEQEREISLFTFRGDNTFAVTVGDKDAQWPWIVSEGKILLGESRLELEIVAENEITIDGVQYLRNPELN